ncbi:DUF4012 domain-containing protein [Actinoplanes sp. NBC_00393]|uniref:DUF4012 domain-containing protein n=1 Tax=Actinoplanes sp. NBC_00393 TaxID=2975953 RepID=UPI002E215AB5
MENGEQPRDEITPPTDPPKRIRRLYIAIGAGLTIALLAGAGLTGLHGVTTKDHLYQAAGLFRELRQELVDTDLDAARGTVVELQRETRSARDATDGWDWATASRIPFVGDDITTVRTVSRTLDELTHGGLPPLLDAASLLGPETWAPSGGKLNVANISAASSRIATGLAAIQSARRSVATIGTAGLTDQLSAAVREMSDGLADAERLVGVVDRAARLLPGLLGARGPRHYLVLFQNNAEVRATGGMPGAYVVVKADAGAVSISDGGSTTSDLQPFDSPVLRLSTDMESLYTDRLATFPANVNLTPDFPLAAQLARAMYQKRKRLAVDGVIATDPVALSYLLRVTGAVKVSGGEPLTADNAVRLLLSEVYSRYPDPSDQDTYFSAAAQAVFAALLTGRGEPQGFISAIARAAGERRLLVWSADPEEEAIVTDTVLAGRMPNDDGRTPTVGVFLNDGGGSKLSYYLVPSAMLRVGDCETDGGRAMRLKVTIGSTAPRSGLPDYVTGLALSGDKYTSRTNVMIFSPTGGAVESVEEDGELIDFGTGMERNRGVGVITLDLPPGKTRTLDITLRAGTIPDAEEAVTARLWTTPTVHPWKSSVTGGAACSGAR